MNTSISAVIKNRQISKSFSQLSGIVSGIVADGHLHDMEIMYLRTWLTENSELRETWPASVIWRRINETLRDGVIDEQERAQLMDCLMQLSTDRFAETGSSSAEPMPLPIEDSVTVTLQNTAFCLTGTFVFGTRAACERATLKAGGTVADSVTKNVDVLVIGTLVSPAWHQTSYGRKIERAMGLQESGHPIEIISEARWVAALSPT